MEPIEFALTLSYDHVAEAPYQPKPIPVVARPPPKTRVVKPTRMANINLEPVLAEDEKTVDEETLERMRKTKEIIRNLNASNLAKITVQTLQEYHDILFPDEMIDVKANKIKLLNYLKERLQFQKITRR